MNILFSFRFRLMICFGFIAAMLTVRFGMSGSIRFAFLVWNLFLAWLPYMFSLFAFSERKLSKPARAALMIAWLAFFPNALYVITDIIHLRQTDNIPIWYDAVLLFVAASAGLLLAFASLLNAEKFFSTRMNWKYIQLLIAGLIFLGSFGVYIGRFLRWNSWSVMTHPFSLLEDIALRFIYPHEYPKTWAVTFFLTAVYGVIWYLIKATINSFKKKSRQICRLLYIAIIF